MDLNKIKFILSEVDGVITDGKLPMGELGIPMFKTFCIKDFEAINKIKKDYGFAFISTDASITMSLCKKKNIPFFFVENNKKEVFNKILMKYNLSADEVLYVGCSYSDIECIRLSGVSVCPEDSVVQVKNIVTYVVPVYSGEGTLCYVYELLKKSGGNDE